MSLRYENLEGYELHYFPDIYFNKRLLKLIILRKSRQRQRLKLLVILSGLPQGAKINELTSEIEALKATLVFLFSKVG